LRLTASAELTEARIRLQYQVVPFALLFMGIPAGGLKAMPEFYLFQIMALLILLVACGNVTMLVFARTATRFREMAVRTALGASRTRIVSQIFVETLVLAVVAAGVGLVSINWIIGRIPFEALAGTTMMPYWLSLQVTREAVLWALVWAVLSATVAGVVPALRITGKKVQRNIQRAEAGRSGIRFGGVTSALIMADVAISVVVVGVAGWALGPTHGHDPCGRADGHSSSRVPRGRAASAEQPDGGRWRGGHRPVQGAPRIYTAGIGRPA
jgi:hypothetical protein